MIQTAVIDKFNLRPQVRKLFQQCRINHDKWQQDFAMNAAKIGGRVTSSFWEVTEKTDFSKDDMQKALLDLGIDMNKCEGKKWYQIFTSDSDIRFLNALKQIPV